MLRRGHFGSGVCAQRRHDFSRAIPAGMERGTSRLSTCSVVGCPPLPELLIPSLPVQQCDRALELLWSLEAQPNLKALFDTLVV